jgi:hypothetical protein
MAKEWTPMKLKRVSQALLLVSLALFAGLASHANAGPLVDILSPTPNWSDYPDWLGFPAQTGSLYGYTVSSAGDVDCDGYADIAVGSSKFSDQLDREGSVFVYYGNPVAPADVPDWHYTSGAAGSLFGSAVSSAGDVNNDGCDDLIIGAYRYKNGEAGEGAAFLFLGSHGGLSATPSWSYESNVKEAQFGYAVSSAGDVNHDGFDDVLIGANTYALGQVNEGAAFLFYGSASGLSPLPDWSYESNQDAALLGSSVSAAGDVNHDGFDDVLVGAPVFDEGQVDEGMVFIFHGSSSGLSLSANTLLQSNVQGAWFGHSLSSAGDVNNDGFTDIIIGAPRYFDEVSGQEYEGSAFVYHGSLSGIQAVPAWRYESNQIWANFGWSVAGAGDVNNDGFDDVLIGAPLYDYDQPDEGAAFVFRGSPLGVVLWPEWRGEGNQATTQYGWSVATAGDTNDDGCADVLTGAPEYMKDDKTKMGRAFLYFGIENLQVPQFTIHLPFVINNP